MKMVEIVVKVPADYVRDAEDFGMLDPETIVQVLREALDERILKFVDAEVKAQRAESRAKRTLDSEQ